MDLGNIIAILGIILGSGSFTLLIQYFLKRKKLSLELKKENAETEDELRERYRQKANRMAEKVLELETIVFDLERRIAEGIRMEKELQEKYDRAAKKINELQKNAPSNENHT
jgi:uncharacterized protein YneF (UPF0154 family)